MFQAAKSPETSIESRLFFLIPDPHEQAMEDDMENLAGFGTFLGGLGIFFIGLGVLWFVTVYKDINKKE